METLEKVS